MTLKEINHKLLRTQWVIDNTTNRKCKADHIKHYRKLKQQKERLLKEMLNGKEVNKDTSNNNGE